MDPSGPEAVPNRSPLGLGGTLREKPGRGMGLAMAAAERVTWDHSGEIWGTWGILRSGGGGGCSFLMQFNKYARVTSWSEVKNTSLKTVYMTANLSLLSNVKPCDMGGDHI